MKTMLVTGATSGLGKAIALRAASEGFRVLALGRNADSLKFLSSQPNIIAVAAELTNREALLKAIESEEIDVLVNNAGIMPPLGDFQSSELASIDKAIAVNFTAQVALTHMVVQGMCARGKGHVFFTGSTAGHAAVANMAIYCATKAAVGGFAQSLRLDLAPHGIRVTEIVAGRIETNLYKDILPAERRAQMYAGGVAVQPNDVAKMLLTVLSLPENACVSRFDIVPSQIV